MSLYTDEQLSELTGLEIADKGIKYFTRKHLDKISTDRRNTFVYQPVKSKVNAVNAAFPWMIAEFKKEFGDEPECLRQAANASYTSYKIIEQLAVPAAKYTSPVVAFTFVGPRAKLFLTYKSNCAEKNCYVCSCLRIS